MVRDNIIKTYTFLETNGNSNTIDQYSDYPINGEVLRINTFSNFTGSVILRESGTSALFSNHTSTSGTNSWTTIPFSNTTGSFMLNDHLFLRIGSATSGTAHRIGPITVLYR